MSAGEPEGCACDTVTALPGEASISTETHKTAVQGFEQKIAECFVDSAILRILALSLYIIP